MKNVVLSIIIRQCKINDLSEDEQRLVTRAIEATKMAYSPYSHFSVGAALLLEDATIITGANQENASYPAGMCAERSALYNAQSNHPNKSIQAIAIAARNSDGLTPEPISPCGICRQALLEIEQRYNNDIRLYLYGTDYINVVNSVKDLLPLSFTDKSMK